MTKYYSSQPIVVVVLIVVVVIIIIVIIYYSILYLLRIEFRYFFMDGLFYLKYWITGSKSLHDLMFFFIFHFNFFLILLFNIDF